MRLSIAIALLLTAFQISPMANAENWPGWRGPRGDGSVTETDVPTKWNGLTGENIEWKQQLPGTGHSSPVVWENAVFLTACRLDDQSRILMRVDADSGKLIWQKTV